MAKKGFNFGKKSSGSREVTGKNQIIAKRPQAKLGKVTSFKERGGYGLRGK